MPVQPSSSQTEEVQGGGGGGGEGGAETPTMEEVNTNGELQEEEEEQRHPEEDTHTAGGGQNACTGGGGEEETLMEESMEEREDTELEETDEEEEEEEEEEEDDEEEEEEEEESSEMDDEDCERRRGECLEEMIDLEKQFHHLKDKLFRERVSQVKEKLDEVLTGRAGEYREPLESLQDSMRLRIQVAGVYRELCLQVIQHKYECELQGARQHLESERTLLLDVMKTELLDKIRRLEEEDRTSEWWSDELKGKKCKRKNLVLRPDRKRRCQLVSGPFIVYMLRDLDILEDWTAIKKAKAALAPLKKKADSTSHPIFKARHTHLRQLSCQNEGGRGRSNALSGRLFGVSSLPCLKLA